MTRHRIPLVYDDKSDEAVVLAFSKKKVEARKEWLTGFMEVSLHSLFLRLADASDAHRDF